MTSWILREVVKINRRKYLLVEVVFTGKYWNRVKLAQNDFAASDRAKEFSVILPQVLLGETPMKKLHNQLAKWLRTPIERFVTESLTLKEELAGLNSQSFMIEFGKRKELITNIGHTACTISYKTNGLVGETSYVVDQSCIQTFFDGLSNYFKTEA